MKGEITRGCNDGTVELEDVKEQDDEEDHIISVLYTVDETPPWHLCLLLGFQVRCRHLSVETG